ncbi:MAG: serine/threonine protein kinase [Planctomycetaceae bacterium]|nr:serine/threonine protein kinase [Planctomycetaceae bacterium]
MPPRDDNSGPKESSLAERIRREELLDQFENAWQNGPRPDLLQFVGELSQPRPVELQRELLRLDCEYRRRAGERPLASDYAGLWPDGAAEIDAILSKGAPQVAQPHAGQQGTDGSGPQPTRRWDSTEMIVGTQLGPNVLLEKLGQGGMGAVYKARHQHLDKLVAIKILPAQFTQHPEFVSRFRREMRAVGKIDHPHIVRAMDAGEINGVHYLTMEYVDGRDLSQVVREKGPISVTSACKAIRQAALALGAAHEAGLVHRDVKPSNLLVSKSGQIKLLDLGLARLGEDAAAATEVTAAGQSFGTPDYMAPEQWADSHSADARADLYALGCTLFFLLIGRAPYGDDQHRHPLNKMSGHCREPIPDLKAARDDVPDGVVAIYQKLMAKNPDDRFQSATELVTAMSAFTSGKSPPEAQPPRGVDRAAALPADRTSVPQETDVAFPPLDDQGASASPARRSSGSKPSNATKVAVITLAVVVLVGGGLVLSSILRSPVTGRAEPAIASEAVVAATEIADAAPVNPEPPPAEPAPVEAVLEPAGEPVVTPSGSPRWPFDPADGQTYVWSSPQSLGPNVNSARHEMVWGLSDDECTIYFARSRLFASQRASRTEPFGNASPNNLVRFLDASGTMTPDGLVLVGSKLSDTGEETLWMSARANIADAFSEPVKLPAPVNGKGPTLHPVLSPDGLTLLACSSRPGSESGDVWMFTRTSREAPFRTFKRLFEPVNTSDWDMPAAITNDRKFLIASIQRSEAGRLTRVYRFFTRESANVPFGPGQAVDLPLGVAADLDSNGGYRVSADGLSLYFSSEVLGGGQQTDLYVCRRVQAAEASVGAAAERSFVE